jgi:hypothetical protein
MSVQTIWAVKVEARSAQASNSIDEVQMCIPKAREVINTEQYRFSRYFLTRRFLKFPSMGHALVFLAYIIINICVTFTKIDWTNLTSISKRLGW